MRSGKSTPEQPVYKKERGLPAPIWFIALLAIMAMFIVGVLPLLQSTEASPASTAISASKEQLTVASTGNIITIDNVPIVSAIESPPNILIGNIDLQVRYKASQKMVEIKANNVPENTFAKVKFYDDNGIILFSNGKEHSKDVLLQSGTMSYLMIFPDETVRPMEHIKRIDVIISS
jgi:uncharacterized membrane protein